MTPGVHYLIRAAELDARAKQAESLSIRHEFENLARAFRRLADRAARNAEVCEKLPLRAEPSD